MIVFKSKNENSDSNNEDKNDKISNEARQAHWDKTRKELQSKGILDSVNSPLKGLRELPDDLKNETIFDKLNLPNTHQFQEFNTNLVENNSLLILKKISDQLNQTNEALLNLTKQVQKLEEIISNNINSNLING